MARSVDPRAVLPPGDPESGLHTNPPTGRRGKHSVGRQTPDRLGGLGYQRWWCMGWPESQMGSFSHTISDRSVRGALHRDATAGRRRGAMLYRHDLDRWRELG